MSGRRRGGGRRPGFVARLPAISAALVAAAIVAAAVPVAVAVAGASGPIRPVRPVVLASASRIVAVGAENEYADVISQIGGRYVKATAIMRNPSTDPHTFEASPSVARVVASAQLVVQNGLGYDTFMQTIEDASPSASRKVIVVQKLLGKPASTRNPHLWYAPKTMPAVAAAVAKDLSVLDPAHRPAFRRNLSYFDASLHAWTRAIANLRAKFKGTPVATTEPVADYLLQAAGLRNETPFSFQADVMNGVDPSPQDVAAEERLLSQRKVKAFVYNVQVTDTLTESLLAIAHRAHVPVVGVYETMPAPGYDYQRWMLAEVYALRTAIARRVSAPKL
ncbi:MAG TPA: zinc ABC transporter substrate-binding protein [Acidimicrobiales bacterium]|nr:zinc ABC transporter substrate-binding protein [Acidimicrobiales bacterium]